MSLKIEVAEDGGKLVEEPLEELQKSIADPYFVHYLGILLRPGVQDCIQLLEHAHFPPGTPRNDLFHMRLIEWMDVTWVMIGIPIGNKGLMESAAQVNGLRAVNKVPVVIDSDGEHLFPARNERVFVLENTPGHPAYLNV